MPTFVYILAYWLIRFVVSAVRSFVQASVVRKGGPQVITLNLQFARTVAKHSLHSLRLLAHRGRLRAAGANRVLRLRFPVARGPFRS